MKKIFAICIALMVTASFAFAQTDAKAEFKFEKEVHDFGNIPQNKPVTFEFKFTNVGQEPLIIQKIVAACGCTTPTYTMIPVKPGETGFIKVEFNAAALNAFQKGITVYSNSKTPIKILNIKGVVEVPTARQ